MCGIFGFIGSPQRARQIDLDEAILSLRHRGPDACGRFYSEDLERGVACAFAHTRLRIIDISDAGNQPMSTADGRFTINYNGEIFNHRQLRSELQSEGVSFVSTCDTEVALKAYARWGAECVRRFRGIFAFAIWDRAERSLFFARDHIGVKPFYYYHDGERFLFASEVRTLLRCGEIDRTLSKEAIASYLAFGSLQDPMTVIRNVHALLPGHFGTLRNGKLDVRRYWSVPEARPEPMTFASALERVQPVLKESVALQLMSDAPLGIFLSGGVDSSSIVAMAARASSAPLYTFTVVFDDEAYNEEAFAATVAKRFGCEHHPVRLPDSPVTAIDRYFDCIDQPSVDGINTYFVSQAARQAGLSVALSGTGGDELFAGYDAFRSISRILALAPVGGRLFSVLDPVVNRFDPLALRNRVTKSIAILRARGELEKTYAALRAVFTPSQVEALAPDLRAASNHNSDRRAVRDPVTSYSMCEISGYLRNTLLRDADVMSMAHSLEERVPLVDYRLVETMAAIPGPLKLGATNKPLLAHASGALPDEVIRRPKMGFSLPMDDWFRGPLRNRIADTLTGVSTDRMVFFEPARLRRVWDAFLKGPEYMSWSRVWTLVTLLDWCERNQVNRWS